MNFTKIVIYQSNFVLLTANKSGRFYIRPPGAAIQYQRIQCQRIQCQRFDNFYCFLLTIHCKYEQLLYILLSKKTNISKMTSDLLGPNRQFEINQTRGVGTKCVGTKQLRLIIYNFDFTCLYLFSSCWEVLSVNCSTS